MKNIRVAVIGMGNMGTAHATCIANGEIDGMTVTAICDINRAKTASFQKTWPEIKTYTDYRALFEEKTADAVILAVPHPLHAEIAVEALKNNLHVLVEKPADISVSKVGMLNKTAEESDRVFGIMFNQRTNPLFKKAREIVKSGQLGELKRTVWIVTNWYRTQCYYDSSDWRATWAGEGGGVLLNQAPHNLDLWQWICGMPKAVTGFCNIAKYHHIEVEDDATLITRYENGAVGTFITSTGEYPGTNRLEISGDSGKLVLENGVLKWWKLKKSVKAVIADSDQGFAEIDYDYEEIKQEEPETAHKGILQNFANAVLFGEPLIAPGTDGIYELSLSNAAYLSSARGNAEIELPFDAAEFDGLLSTLAAGETPCGRHAARDGEDRSSCYKARWMVNW